MADVLAIKKTAFASGLGRIGRIAGIPLLADGDRFVQLLSCARAPVSHW